MSPLLRIQKCRTCSTGDCSNHCIIVIGIRLDLISKADGILERKVPHRWKRKDFLPELVDEGQLRWISLCPRTPYTDTKRLSTGEDSHIL